MRRLAPLLVLAAAILAAAGLLAGSAWYGREDAREARLETVRVKAREAVGDVVRRFDGELEALVEREAARPFFLYQHYYSPPEAISAQFVFQTSPLASATEPLIDVWFEILPDGTLSLPADEPDGPIDEAGHRLVSREVLPELIARVHRAPPRAEPAAAPAAVAQNVLPPPAVEAPAVEPPPPAARPARPRSTQRRPASNAEPSSQATDPPEPASSTTSSSNDESQATNPSSPPVDPQAGQPSDGSQGGGVPQAQRGGEPQVSQMPRWAVEANVRANEFARQIEVANTGDVTTQQQLQNDFNMMRGLPQQQAIPPPAPDPNGPEAAAEPEPRAPSPESRVPSPEPESRAPSPEPRAPSPSPSPEPRAPSPSPSPSSEPRAPSPSPRPEPESRAPSPSTSPEPRAPSPSPSPSSEPRAPSPSTSTSTSTARRDPSPSTSTSTARRDPSPSPSTSTSSERRDPSTSPPTTLATAAVAESPTPTPTPTPTESTTTTPAEGDEVSVVYGAFEPLERPDGQRYYVRTVDIEGDVRVQGFRLSPGGLRATLGNVVLEVQRSHDAFDLVAGEAAGGSLAAALVDGVPGASRVAAVLRAGSPTLDAEDREDRRVLMILGGLSAVIAVAVMLAFLVLRREMELARRQGEFLSAVSHELRAPVTTIRMYAEMLRDGWVEDGARRTEYESAIVSEGERLSRLVENVLAYSRRERGKPLTLREADLAEKVREVAGVQRPVFERAKLALEVEAPETLPWRFDPDAVTQILVNLLDNALKHSGDAEERRVVVALEGAPDAATLSVRDHGPGIAAAEQKRIFEAFYRVGSELTRETRGTGLGLALVRRLARAHGGDVAVSSEPGRGATFTVILGRAR